MKKRVLSALAIVVATAFVACGDKTQEVNVITGPSAVPGTTPLPTTPLPQFPTNPAIGPMRLSVIKTGEVTYRITIAGDMNAALDRPADLANRPVRLREWSCSDLTIYIGGTVRQNDGTTVISIADIISCGSVIDFSLQLDVGTGSPMIDFTFPEVNVGKVQLEPPTLRFKQVAGEIHVQGSL